MPKYELLTFFKGTAEACQQCVTFLRGLLWVSRATGYEVDSTKVIKVETESSITAPQEAIDLIKKVSHSKRKFKFGPTIVSKAESIRSPQSWITDSEAASRELKIVKGQG